MLHSVTPSFPAVYQAEFFGAEAANDCTPPVQQAAIAVVAHPLAVGGGECLRIHSVAPGNAGCCREIRDDFLDGWRAPWGDSVTGAVFGAGMDAPCYLPSGSHTSFVVGSGRKWAYAVLDGRCASREGF